MVNKKNKIKEAQTENKTEKVEEGRKKEKRRKKAKRKKMKRDGKGKRKKKKGSLSKVGVRKSTFQKKVIFLFLSLISFVKRKTNKNVSSSKSYSIQYPKQNK